MFTTLPESAVMFTAFEERNPQYEGVFFAGVRTTGVFCRPTCRAKKPRRENVEFFATAKEALDNGYRPCKICRPMEPAGGNPDWVQALLARCQADAEDGIRDADLLAMGLEPATVRRWFKKHHGITFHQYLRQLRMNRAYSALRHGGESRPRSESPRARRRACVTETAFDSGYESLSGFSDAFRRTTGFAPSQSRRRTVVSLARIPTPLGTMVACAVDGSLCLLEFADRPMLETQLHRVSKSFDANIVVGEDPLFEEIAGQLREYFDGERREFDLPIADFGSPFQKSVWRALRNIPYGESRSYAEQAAAIGRPSATRAVARANGDNRIAIVIPCHRVIGSDGSLTGYGGGLRRKRALLELEGML
jgi:AraC family transcriptional regulator of adaptative response/methylated-DNA-[protein]-cysteine methyltransferase